MTSKHSRTTLRIGALAACALVLLPTFPTAVAQSTSESIFQTTSFNIFAPAAGSGYWFKSGCANTGSCLRIEPGGWVEWTFNLGAPADFLRFFDTGDSSEVCTYTLKWNLGGVPQDQIRQDWCAETTWMINDWGTQFDGLYYDSFIGSTYTFRLGCDLGSCWGVDIFYSAVKAGYYPLNLLPLTSQASTRLLSGAIDTTPEQCVNVEAFGSRWNGVDYFRVTWGDGTETFDSVYFTLDGYWTRRYCHEYPISTQKYQVCVTAHDTLNRLVRECKDVSWGVEL